MKIITIDRDHAGGFHCAIVKNPDFFRRDIAASTGRAEIIWASTAVLDGNPLGSAAVPGSQNLQHDLGFAAAIGWTVTVRPLPYRVLTRLRRTLRRASGVALLRRIRFRCEATGGEVAHDQAQ